jgi:outer membrane protein OmpA-like peptidoglycan-associated protein
MGKGIGPNDGYVIDISELGIIEGWLSGFDIDSAGLKVKHRAWLDNHVVPVLQGGGSIAITGMASRSGAAAHNLALSKRRASAVLVSWPECP